MDLFDRRVFLHLADLSKNRLTEIPPEVCLFAPLESLNLYHNCIKCIPEAIINLQMLTYLDIRSVTNTRRSDCTVYTVQYVFSLGAQEELVPLSVHWHDKNDYTEGRHFLFF